jgi:Asp-tRNA(Asn)/Glu-tRNA(Gln) amidotransferase A subunit family amidase
MSLVSTRVDRALHAVAAQDPQVRAFCDVRDAAARVEAAALDAAPLAMHKALHGVPVAIKEVFDVAGCLCEWGSPVHAGRRPVVDCEAVARLKAAGAVVVGTTASTEYAMARAAPTVNPYALDRSPGASSSGSAAAVAARFVDLALGTQTIGSGIRPAAYCGVFGLKPTHGAIPLQGMMPLSATLDHGVVFARELGLLETALGVLAQHAAGPAAPMASRLALVDPWFDEPVDPQLWERVVAAARQLCEGPPQGMGVPDFVRHNERDCLETILAADMWRHHAADEQAAGEHMSPELKAWLERGRHVGGQAYQDALAQRDAIAGAMAAALQAVDLVVTLATTGAAPLLSEGSGSRAPQRLWTLMGWPALSVPIGLIDGLPVAVQLVARPHEEQRLLSAARQLASAFTTPAPAAVPAGGPG